MLCIIPIVIRGKTRKHELMFSLFTSKSSESFKFSMYGKRKCRHIGGLDWIGINSLNVNLLTGGTVMLLNLTNVAIEAVFVSLLFLSSFFPFCFLFNSGHFLFWDSPFQNLN